MKAGKVKILKWTIRQAKADDPSGWQNIGAMPARSAAEAVKFQYPDMAIAERADQPGRFKVQNLKDPKWTLDVIVQQAK